MRKFEVYKNGSRSVIFETYVEECHAITNVYQLKSGEELQLTDRFYLAVDLEKAPTDIKDWITHVIDIYEEDGDIMVDDRANADDELTAINDDGWEYYSQFCRTTIKIFPRDIKSKSNEEEVEVEPAKEELELRRQLSRSGRVIFFLLKFLNLSLIKSNLNFT
jgi:hypothetical protein